jgi:transcriptional regulator
LAARPEALVTFMGPQAYMSPKVYPDLARVPTWNYLAVHCRVKASLIEDPLGKDRLLKKLIGDHEPPYKQQWIDLGTEYQHKMLSGIVAFELEVISLECKIKINQHRPEAQAKMLEIYEQGNPQERALAQWIREFKEK